MIIKRSQEEVSADIVTHLATRTGLELWRALVERLPSQLYVAALPATVRPSKSELVALAAALFYQKQAEDLALIQRDLLLKHILKQVEEKPKIRRRIII